VIRDKCLTFEWIAEKRREMSFAQDVTIEKSIRALILLERLVASGLPFLFKGGTCMMLHLKELRRLSVDIDIVCTEGMGTIGTVLQAIARQSPFTQVVEDRRPHDHRPNRVHYKFYYPSTIVGNPEPYVLLDIVVEKLPHAIIETKAIMVPFVECDDPTFVTVPTLDALLGDKLTAFAPTTIGVPYSKGGAAQQIVKQMFDVGELFLHAKQIDDIRLTYDDLFAAENGFRGNSFKREDALRDTKHTALLVGGLDVDTAPTVQRSEKAALRRGITEIGVTLTQAEYTMADAVLHASRAALLATMIQYGFNGRMDDIRYLPEDALNLPATLPDRYASLNPLREINTEAYSNWVKVVHLERSATT
jgi:hypothetical protein